MILIAFYSLIISYISLFCSINCKRFSANNSSQQILLSGLTTSIFFSKFITSPGIFLFSGHLIDSILDFSKLSYYYISVGIVPYIIEKSINPKDQISAVDEYFLVLTSGAA